MKFQEWKQKLLALNEYERQEQQKILEVTLPERRELLALVERTWSCRATGAKVKLNSYGMIEHGEVNVWIQRTSDAAPIHDVSGLEPDELELLAEVKRAARAWLNGEAEAIVVDAPEAPLGRVTTEQASG